MHTNQSLIPNFLRTLKLWAFLVGVLLPIVVLSIGVLDLIDRVMAGNSSGPMNWLLGGFAFVSVGMVLALVRWWLDRRTRWHVNESGIAIHRDGRLVRFLAWREIAALEIAPFAITARVTQSPDEEIIKWVPPGPASWLHQLYVAQAGADPAAPANI